MYVRTFIEVCCLVTSPAGPTLPYCDSSQSWETLGCSCWSLGIGTGSCLLRIKDIYGEKLPAIW